MIAQIYDIGISVGKALISPGMLLAIVIVALALLTGMAGLIVLKAEQILSGRSSQRAVD